MNSLHIELSSNHLNKPDYFRLINELKSLSSIIFKIISDSEIILK